MSDQSNPAAGKVKLSTKLFYGAGSISFGVKDNGFSYFLLIFYNQVLGLSAGLAGTALMIALLFDAVSDPVIGHMSDNWHSKWGRRHPFMYFAGIPVALSYFFLWYVPFDLSELQLFFYLTVMSILVRTFVTVYEIPSTALVSELTDNYDQRTSMLSYRYFFGWWGGLTMAALAYGVFLADFDRSSGDVTETVSGILNRTGYQEYALLACVLMLTGIVVSAVGTHRHIPNLKAPPPRQSFDAIRNVKEILHTLSNKSFLALFLSTVFGAMAGGISTSLYNYMMAYFWHVPPSTLLYFMYLLFGSSALALWLTPRINFHTEKKKVAIILWSIAVFWAPVLVITKLLGFYPPEGSILYVPLLMAHAAIEVTITIMAAITVSSMFADVVEDSELDTGRRSEGLFFAARTFAGKVVGGFGVFMVGIILELVNFSPSTSPDDMDPAIVDNLAITYIPIMMFFYILSVVVIMGYKISREGHIDNIEALSKEEPRGMTGEEVV